MGLTAMSIARVHLTGGEALLKAIEELPRKLQRKVVGPASAKAMAPVLKTARIHVPKSHAVLKKSLGAKQRKYKQGGIVVTLVGPRSGFSTMVPGTRWTWLNKGQANESGVAKPKRVDPVKYAHLVEFGTKPHNETIHINVKTRIEEVSKKYQIAHGTAEKTITVHHPGTKPQPFMRPAYDANRENIVRIYGEELRKQIEKQAKAAYAKSLRGAK